MIHWASSRGGLLEMEGQLGQYRLIAEIARGGMGVVHLAAKSGLEGFRKVVVVKELRPDLALDDGAIAMFMDEARLAARLNHPNIVQTMEVGVDQGRRFIAMEYLEGQPLQLVVRRALERGSPLGLPAHLAILVEVLSALEYAHELRDFDGTPLALVHRDVSPHNVFVTYEGRVKLVDFGISKTAATEAEETRTGLLKGKVRYMAPEQASGARVDRRADLFALGVILWEAVTERRAWGGLNDADVLQKLLAGALPDIRRARADADPELVRIVDRALSRDPRTRYPTALEMREDLERYVEANWVALPGARSLGSTVSRLFDEEREQRRSLLETRLGALSTRAAAVQPNRPASTGTMTPLPVALTPQPPLRSDRNPTAEAAEGVMSAGGAAGFAQRGNARRLWSSLWPVAMATGFGALFALAFLAPSGRTARTSRAPATRSGMGEPAVVSPRRAPTEPSPNVHVVIIASPSSARLYLDDTEVSNPYVADHGRDSVGHFLRVQATGYTTRTRGLSLAENVNLEIDLAPERAALGGAAKAPVRVAKGAAPFDPDRL